MAIDKIAESALFVSTENINKVVAVIADIPADNPFNPSIKFMILENATRYKMVNGYANHPNSIQVFVKGFMILFNKSPELTVIQEAIICIVSFAFGGKHLTSSATPVKNIKTAPAPAMI